MGLVVTIVISGLTGALAALAVTWVIFRRRGEDMPSAYLLPGQLQPLSNFARRLVDYVFPGALKTADEIPHTGNEQILSTATIDDGDSFTCHYPEFLKPERTSSISIVVTRGDQSPEPECADAPSSYHLLDDQAGHYVGLTPGAVDELEAETQLDDRSTVSEWYGRISIRLHFRLDWQKTRDGIHDCRSYEGCGRIG